MSRWADQKISIAFMKMLRTQSVDDVTVIKVCEKAGVNRQSFYYHFKDMNELIQYIVRNKLENTSPKKTYITGGRSAWRKSLTTAGSTSR